MILCLTKKLKLSGGSSDNKDTLSSINISLN